MTTLCKRRPGRLSPLRLDAGMQAEVFIMTDGRTPLQFFLKPVQDQFARAFRERSRSSTWSGGGEAMGLVWAWRRPRHVDACLVNTSAISD